MNELLSIALRALVVYAYLLVLVRLLGKREIGAFSAFDFVVALILGELADEVIFGNITLAKGAVASGTAAGLHYLNSLITYRSRLSRGYCREIPWWSSKTAPYNTLAWLANASTRRSCRRSCGALASKRKTSPISSSPPSRQTATSPFFASTRQSLCCAET